MITYIVLVCSLTAAFSGHVLCETEISLVNKRTAVLQSFYEADTASKLYPNSEIIGQDSYQNVIDRVIDKEVLAVF